MACVDAGPNQSASLPRSLLVIISLWALEGGCGGADIATAEILVLDERVEL